MFLWSVGGSDGREDCELSNQAGNSTADSMSVYTKDRKDTVLRSGLGGGGAVGPGFPEGIRWVHRSPPDGREQSWVGEVECAEALCVVGETASTAELQTMRGRSCRKRSCVCVGFHVIAAYFIISGHLKDHKMCVSFSSLVEPVTQKRFAVRK